MGNAPLLLFGKFDLMGEQSRKQLPPYVIWKLCYIAEHPVAVTTMRNSMAMH